MGKQRLHTEGGDQTGYADRMKRVLDRMDELRMVAILGCFYFGQDERLEDEDQGGREYRGVGVRQG